MLYRIRDSLGTRSTSDKEYPPMRRLGLGLLLLSTLIKAVRAELVVLESGRKVSLTYPDGYSCAGQQRYPLILSWWVLSVGTFKLNTVLSYGAQACERA